MRAKYSGIIEEEIRTTNSVDTLLMIREFFYFLNSLGVKSAIDQAEHTEDVRHQDFCNECDIVRDNCECPRWGDTIDDDAYDRWKDEQMENWP